MTHLTQCVTSVTILPKMKNTFKKVQDNRGQPIRALWIRNERFYARIAIDRALKWIPLEANTPAEAKRALDKLQIERAENSLRHIGKCPTFTDYLPGYLERMSTSKALATFRLHRGHLQRWQRALGPIPLDRIKPKTIADYWHQFQTADKLQSSSCNLALKILRGLFKAAKRDGYLRSLPTADIEPQKTIPKHRRLVTSQDIATICALLPHSPFGDYIKLLCFCGAREKEALRLTWADVDFNRAQLSIGLDGKSKNRDARRIDLNPDLHAHLLAMHNRREPDTFHLFPSTHCPSAHKKSFRALLNALRAKFPPHLSRFAFHDCRHHFISYCVMSGIDFMTIALWAGHKDGGILIGKVYGHLTNEHSKAQAARVRFHEPGQSSPLPPGQAFLPLVAA